MPSAAVLSRFSRLAYVWERLQEAAHTVKQISDELFRARDSAESAWAYGNLATVREGGRAFSRRHLLSCTSIIPYAICHIPHIISYISHHLVHITSSLTYHIISYISHHLVHITERQRIRCRHHYAPKSTSILPVLISSTKSKSSFFLFYFSCFFFFFFFLFSFLLRTSYLQYCNSIIISHMIPIPSHASHTAREHIL